jgi:hypothetical protein
MDTVTEKNTTEKALSEKQKTLQDLQKMQASFRSATGASELITKVKKLDKKWNEADIFTAVALNNYTKPGTLGVPQIAIGSISTDKGKKLSNGLSLGMVNFSLAANSVDDIIDYLTYLTTASEYVFTFDSIALPIDTAPNEVPTGGVSLAVSLGVYYFE